MSTLVAEPWYFRSLHYGYSEPEATVVLWWEVRHDSTLHIIHNWRVQQFTIADLVKTIRTETAGLNIETETSKVRYTVADQENIGTDDTDGESRTQTFARHR